MGGIRVDHRLDSGVPVAQVRCLADVEPQEVRWLWPGRIALGKLTLVCGDPGLGKSFLTLDWAARVSAGRGWPDGAASTGVGSAVLITAEDDLADTIRPRLDAAGADVSRVVALDSIAWRDDRGVVRERAFDLSDAGSLASVVRAVPDCRLLVIDPISAFVGASDSHNNAEIRGLLAPLAKLAADAGVAVVAVTHLSKGGGGRAVYRAMGSLAFVAAARCAWLVARDRENADRRLLLPIKNNLGDDQTGLAYGIVDGAVAWEREPVHVRADDVLGDGGGPATKPGPEQTARAEAIEWLRGLLAAGPVAAAQVRHEAEGMGIAAGTLRRAREQLGVRTVRAASDQPWFWQLPAPTGDNAASGQPRNLRNLRTCASGLPSTETRPFFEGEEPGRAPGADSREGDAAAHPTSSAMSETPAQSHLSKLRRLSSLPGSEGQGAPRLFGGPYGLPDLG